MSQPSRMPSLIPESAPFTAEQRVWLNGLFAGLLSLENGVTPLYAALNCQWAPKALYPQPRAYEQQAATTVFPEPTSPCNSRRIGTAPCISARNSRRTFVCAGVSL